MCGISTKMIIIAFGHNMWDVPFPDITYSLELFWAADQAYTALISLTKLSMCFFFLRIFSHSPTFRRSAYGVIVANVVVWIVFQIMVAFQCRPVSAFWNTWDGEQTNYSCFHLYAFALGQGIVSIVMDIVMISLPIHETLKVKLSTKKKIGVVIMFAMGFAYVQNSSIFGISVPLADLIGGASPFALYKIASHANNPHRWTIIGIVRCVAIWDTRVITNLTGMSGTETLLEIFQASFLLTQSSSRYGASWVLDRLRSLHCNYLCLPSRQPILLQPPDPQDVWLVHRKGNQSEQPVPHVYAPIYPENKKDDWDDLRHDGL